MTNADFAAGHDIVLLFVDHNAPRTGEGPLSRATIEGEVERLRAAGTQVILLEPDGPSLEAMGELNALDPDRIQPAVRAGRRQGRAGGRRPHASRRPGPVLTARVAPEVSRARANRHSSSRR